MQIVPEDKYKTDDENDKDISEQMSLENSKNVLKMRSSNQMDDELEREREFGCSPNTRSNLLGTERTLENSISNQRTLHNKLRS